MEIPKRFKLFGQVINVTHSKTLIHRDDACGLCSYRDNLIILQAASDDNPLPASQIEQSFCHELMHRLFNDGGYADDRNNEDKVDMMGKLLHQFLTTAEYTDKPTSNLVTPRKESTGAR